MHEAKFHFLGLTWLSKVDKSSVANRKKGARKHAYKVKALPHPTQLIPSSLRHGKEEKTDTQDSTLAIPTSCKAWSRSTDKMSGFSTLASRLDTQPY